VRIILQFALVLGILYQPLHACRLWAVCVKSGHSISTLPPEERLIILDELTSFYYQSETMQNGWALLGYNQANSDSVTPIYRSESPAIEDSITYWNSVSTLIDEDNHTIGIGHLRLATSGTNAIPNPHPFMFYEDAQSYSLVHNGTVNKDILYNLITNNGTDISWLIDHEPQTFGGGSWQDDGWSNVVDSDLLMLYIMQNIDASANILIGLETVLTNLVNEGVPLSQLNIIFSNGTNLYIFGGNNGLSIAESAEHYAIMTLPPVNEYLDWLGIANGEMVVINENGVSYYQDFASTESDAPHILAPELFKMYPAYPNPFNGSVTISMDGATNETIDFSIYSLAGELVYNTIMTGPNIGRVEIQWNAKSTKNKTVSSGTYFVRMSTSALLETQKILFIK